MNGENGFVRRLLGALALCGLLAGVPLAAQEASSPLFVDGEDHAWDCWVSQDAPRGVVSYVIRCIHDRPAVDLALIDRHSVDGLLDYVHQMLHAGEFATLDRDLANGLAASIAGYMWSIRIHQYPYESSWDAKLPQRLVQAALCSATDACPVLLFRGGGG